MINKENIQFITITVVILSKLTGVYLTNKGIKEVDLYIFYIGSGTTILAVFVLITFLLFIQKCDFEKSISLTTKT